MKMQIQNNTFVDFSKSFRTVDYYTREFFKRFPQRNKWGLKVWLNTNEDNRNEATTCAMKLSRPGLPSLYVKTDANNFDQAVKKATSTLRKVLKYKTKKLSSKS